MKKFLVFLALVSIVATGHASETIKGAQKDMDAFKQEMTTKLNELDQKITELKTKAASKGDETKEKTAAELEKSRADLQEKFSKAQDTGRSGWKQMKKDMSDSLNKLNAKLQDALKD